MTSMSLEIDQLWRELEDSGREPRKRSGSPAKAWVLRLTKPDPRCDLNVGVELATRRRGLLLRLERKLVPAKRIWPACRGLEVLAVPLDARHALFGVALKDARHADLFTVLAEDLSRRITGADGAVAQVSAMLGGLARWQKFLAASLEGLSDEQQRGLWGELHLLREHLLPAFGASTVNDWKGGERAHQDFQFSTGAIEVKTTLAKQPQVVRITSERQLDYTRWPTLVLHVLALDEQDTVGESLPSMVASLRAVLANDARDLEQLEDELLKYGYLDAHAIRWAERGYTIRAAHFFSVGSKFPCLLEADMPPGVGDANYALSVAACEPFRLEVGEVIEALTAKIIKKKKRRGRD